MCTFFLRPPHDSGFLALPRSVLPSPIVLGHFFLGLTLAIISLFSFKDFLTAGILKAQKQTRNLHQGIKAY